MTFHWVVPRNGVISLTIAWATFVVYGSLLPFDFRPASFFSFSASVDGWIDFLFRVRSWTDWATNVAIFAPLGFLGVLALRGDGEQRGVARLLTSFAVLLACGSLSAAIELAQVFFPPRTPSLFDVAANIVGTISGIAMGAALGSHVAAAARAVLALHNAPPPASASAWAKWVLPGCATLLVVAWSGLLTGHWDGWQGAMGRLSQLRWIPFIEHQSAAIGLATMSALIAAGVYATLGAALWHSAVVRSRQLHTGLLAAGGLTAVVALAVEVAKAFGSTSTPDSGNVVIAAAAAAAGYLLAPLTRYGLNTHNAIARAPALPQSVSTRARSHPAGLTILFVCAACLAAALAILLLVGYPVGRPWLALAMAVYGLAMWRYSAIWLIAIPALLPVLDLAPWTGRFYFDEFDALVLTTLAVGLWQTARQRVAAPGSPALAVAALCFALSFLVSVAIGLMPLQPIDGTAFASHYSHYAAIRLGKAVAFSIGLAVLMQSLIAKGQPVHRNLAAGMALGLAAAVASVMWERIAYASLGDFDKAFRVVGLFSSMHTGGAHLDAYLIAAVPFVAIGSMFARHRTMQALAALLLAGGAYGAAVTYSRAAIVALVLALTAIGVWWLIVRRNPTGTGRQARLPVWLALLLPLAFVLPALTGSFMQSRLDAISQDVDVRASHWRSTMELMSEGWRTTLLGMGIGRFPETYQVLSQAGNRPAVHQFLNDGRNGFLRIHHGAPLYVEQIVDVAPQADYVVRMRIRTDAPLATVHALLCDRTYLGGFGCQSVTAEIKEANGRWLSFEAALNSRTVGANRMRTTKLSLENAQPGTTVDIDDVALLDAAGVNHLRNADFEHGADLWYYSSPYNHSPWHMVSVWLEVIFSQGWIGLLTFSAMLVVATRHLARLAAGGDRFSAALLASLIGLFAVGAFDSLLDSPRIILLLGLFIGAAIARGAPRALPAASGQRIVATSPSRKPAVGTSSPKPMRPLLLWLGIGVLIVAAGIAVVTRLPYVPYNIRELPNPLHPIAAPIVLAIFLYWVFGAPARIAQWLFRSPSAGALLPVALLGHGFMGWLLLQVAVLPESIHDIVGSPILDWPYPIEYVTRMVPLLTALTLPLTFGILMTMQGPVRQRTVALTWLAMTAVLLVPGQYWVIVEWAATDNLTELMANNASGAAFLALVGYLTVAATAGAAIVRAWHASSVGGRLFTLLAVVASLPLGYGLVQWGTEATIVKDGATFSAIQFLLSTDREHLVQGPQLWLRFAVAHSMLLMMIVLTQRPFWSRKATALKKAALPPMATP